MLDASQLSLFCSILMLKNFNLSIILLLFVLSALSVFGQVNNVRGFNEKLPVKSLTEILAAQETFRAANANGNYASALELRNAGFIDAALAAGEKYGYVFLFTNTDRTPVTPAAFSVTATPRRYRKTGIRSFFIDHRGEVRGADKNGETATSGDPLLDFCKIIESSNEKCVIKELRLLLSAEFTFQATVGNGNFGSLEQLYAARLIKESLAVGYLHQYNFQVFYTNHSPQNPAEFRVFATPAQYGTGSLRSFFIDNSGIIRGADRNGQRAGENDPPITD